MSTVIQFPSRSVAHPQPEIRSAKTESVVSLAEHKARKKKCHSSSAPSRRQAVDSAGEIRELVSVSPLENGLIQALFSGLDHAAEYLRKHAAMPPSTYTYQPNDFADGWRILWISGAEVDLFNYIENFGLHAGADLLSKRARDRRAGEKPAIARARKRGRATAMQAGEA